MLDRRTFIGALAAGGAFASYPLLAADGVRTDRAAPGEAVRAEIATGRVSCVACGANGAAALSLGNRRPGLGEPVPVGVDSLFEIASVSKTFTALLAALLWHEGRLDLDAPFTTYLPDHVMAKEGTAVTIRDLASHVSGFTNGWMGKAGVYGSGPWPFADDAAYERAVLSVRPSFARGAKCVYSCTNMILLGFILERAGGCDLDRLARKCVWEPLGMRATTWKDVPDDPRTVRIWTNGWRPLGTKGDENARRVKRPIGNAGVFSTLGDLLRYADDLANRRTFPKACYDLLFTPHSGSGRGRRSFGWDMGAGTNPPGWSAASVNHAGYTGQYVAVDPESHRSAVVLTNLSSADPKARGANFEFRRTLAAALRPTH